MTAWIEKEQEVLKSEAKTKNSKVNIKEYACHCK